jgi:predicted nucleotidyltransferase
MMYQDFLELLRVFESHKVRYIVIGGYAVGIHAEPRFTKDLDILIEPSETNAKRVYKALNKFGAPTDNLTIEDLATPGLLYMFGVPPLRVDILNRIKGTNPSLLIKRGKKINIADTHLKVVCLEDLIKLKKIADRPQDRVDIMKLKLLNPTRRKSKKSKK